MVPSAYVELERLPLTLNGKVDRRSLPKPEWSREEEYEAPQTPTEEILSGIWAEVLGVERVGRQDNFFALGGDSILAIRIISHIRQAGLDLTVRQMFQHQTIAELALVAGEKIITLISGERVRGKFVATPIQMRFLQEKRTKPWHYNQSRLLATTAEVQGYALRTAVAALVEHHDMLRLRCSEGQLEIDDSETNRIWICVDLSDLPLSQEARALERIGGQLQECLNLEQGPIVRVAWFRMKDGDRLLLVIHHLAVDGVSWRILLEDLERAYKQAVKRQNVDLPAKTSAYPHWAEELIRYAGSTEVEDQEKYWQSVAERGSASLPKDNDNGSNLISSTDVVAVEFPEEETQLLLHHLPKLDGAGLLEGLLLAVQEAICKWTKQLRIVVDIEGHGREEIGGGVDVSRTVGWFTTIYPILLERRAGLSLGSQLNELKQRLKNVPHKGIGYGLLRYTRASHRLEAARKPEIAFNYLGQFDEGRSGKGIWRFADETSGSQEYVEERREHILEISAVVERGSLILWCRYSRQIHRRQTVKYLLDEMTTVLHQLLHVNPITVQSPNSNLEIDGNTLKPEEWTSLFEELIQDE
jgi:non-ribosomal peptide synthase protein (TIGR01720 family)